MSYGRGEVQIEARAGRGRCVLKVVEPRPTTTHDAPVRWCLLLGPFRSWRSRYGNIVVLYVTSRSSSASQTDRALNELARCTPAARGELESWLGLNVSRRPSFLCTPNVILAQLSTRRKEIVDIYALVFIHTYLVSVVMNEWE